MEEELRQAKKSDLVKINFTCKRKDGSLYDSSEGKEPLQFIIGEGEVFPFLEEAVIGMTCNETKQIYVKAEEIFGPYLHEKAQVVSKDQFPAGFSPEVGLQFHIKQPDGKTDVLTVTDVTESDATLTPKHPLAGEELFFDVQLLEVEDSTISKAKEFFNQGIAFQDAGLTEEAISAFQRAIQQNPHHAESFYHLGVIFQQKGVLDNAITSYEIAIGLNKELTEAHHNLGIAYKDKGQFDEAITCFQSILQLKPNHAGAYYNLGNTLVAKGQFNQALQLYQKAIEIDPEFADAHFSIALIKLRLGDFGDGWKGYEWRWKLKDIIVKRDFPQPIWDGSDIKGQTIFLYSEQRLGDTIQFIRYAPMIAQRGANVIVECQRELTMLLQNVKGIHKIIGQKEPLPEFDMHCPLLSLPFILGTTIENIPSKIPYISADPSLIKKWYDKIALDDSRYKVGLIWSGDPKFKDDNSRSCPLALFSPLAYLDDVTFYSLQKGKVVEQAKNCTEELKLIDYTDDINNFADTAAFMENLDLIISVDTAAAHLAGALGKSVWTLLPFIPDWRWMLDREDSPWYPTMRLFRQPSHGDWLSVIDRIKEALIIFCSCA